MEPRIQYAKTSDGVDIAFARGGDGPPLLLMLPPPFTHVQAAWATLAPIRASAERYQVIWYDGRGSGLSDRDAVDFSMEAMVRDLEAVVARTVLESFVLLSIGDGVPVAVTFAA